MTPLPGSAPVHQSLVRPILLAGVELAPAVAELFLVLLLALGFGVSPFSLTFALVTGSISHILLLRAAKEDPQLCAVYTRHIRYQTFYPALSHPTAPCACPPPTWF